MLLFAYHHVVFTYVTLSVRGMTYGTLGRKGFVRRHSCDATNDSEACDTNPMNICKGQESWECTVNHRHEHTKFNICVWFPEAVVTSGSLSLVRGRQPV